MAFMNEERQLLAANYNGPPHQPGGSSLAELERH
jgi:hypothetical protein